jgi:hypothetical protein
MLLCICCSKDQFDVLMTLNTPARHEQLPHAARVLADTAEFADAEVWTQTCIVLAC